MSRARDFADLAGSADAGGLTGRNLIINPSGAVDQRGGSSTINAYSVDRWRSFGGPGGFTISQRTDAGEGDGYAIRFHRTASNTQTNSMGIAQGFETVDSKRLAGKTLTVSFRARKGADWSPTNFDAVVYHGTGTDENPVGMTGQGTIVAVDDASLTTSFQTFTGSVTVPSGKTQVTLGFRWDPSGTAGANDYVDIREVQLELGEKATPFEHRSYGDELARCQRYCQIWNFGSSYQGGGGFSGAIYSADLAFVTIPYFCEMRASPTGTISDKSTWQLINPSDAPDAVNSISMYGQGKTSATIQVDPSTSASTPTASATSGCILWPDNSSSTDATVRLDAEL